MGSVTVAKVLGVGVAFLVPISALWAFAASVCRDMGGGVTNFALSCQVPACDPVLLATYIPIQAAALAFVFLGMPFGFTAYSVVLRTAQPLPPK